MYAEEANGGTVAEEAGKGQSEAARAQLQPPASMREGQQLVLIAVERRDRGAAPQAELFSARTVIFMRFTFRFFPAFWIL